MVGFDNLQSFCKGYKKKQHNMNTKNKILAGLFSMAALFSSCNDFQEINEDPNQVDEINADIENRPANILFFVFI